MDTMGTKNTKKSVVLNHTIKTFVPFVFFVSFASIVFFVLLAQENVSVPELSADLERFVDNVLALDITPGMTIAIVRDKEVIYAKGFGVADHDTRRPVTADTQFYIASTTKSITALAAAVLAQRKAIDLDAPLSGALPGVKLHERLSADRITLRDLLTHTHGIAPGGPVDFRTAYTGDFTGPQLLDLLAAHPPAPSGRSFSYSNLGYNIFSLVLDRVFREGWKEVIDREVLRPLGMRNTTAFMSKTDRSQLAQPYELRPDGPQRVNYAKQDGNMHAAGGYLSTANDLARYLIAHINGGRIGTTQAIPQKAIAETHRQQAVQDRVFGSFQRFGWGLGWDLATYDGDTVLQRFGGFRGFFSHVSFMPARRIGVVVLANGGSAGGMVADAVATFAYDRLLNKPPQRQQDRWREFTDAVARGRASIARDLATRQSRPQTTPLALPAYAGTYESRALGSMVWTLENNRLQVAMGIARGMAEAYDAAKHQFRVDLTGGGSVVSFRVTPGAPAPESLQFQNQTFTRVR